MYVRVAMIEVTSQSSLQCIYENAYGFYFPNENEMVHMKKDGLL